MYLSPVSLPAVVLSISCVAAVGSANGVPSSAGVGSAVLDLSSTELVEARPETEAERKERETAQNSLDIY